MKLATLDNGTRDGRPVLVSRDMRHATSVDDVAGNLLQALEDWDKISETLEKRYEALNAGTVRDVFTFDVNKALAPLPRAPQWLDASAFPSHGERMVLAFGLSDATLKVDHPLMYQGCSDSFLGARTTVPLPSEADGIDLEGEMAVFTAEVPMGSSPEDCLGRIRLLALVDDISLRNLLFAEMSLGFGMIQCKPTSVFSPVCVTPDELGFKWRDGRVHQDLICRINGVQLGCVSGSEMQYSFGELIAHAARTRLLSAGTIVGSGTFSNRDASVGTTCLSETRALEKLTQGTITTPWLRFGDQVEIEMRDEQGASIFGCIDHTFAQVKHGVRVDG